MPQSAHRWLMTAPGELLVSREFEPEVKDGEVLLDVAGCGVCHTDLGFLYDGVRIRHELPLALGHEISGRVVATGRGAEAWQGKAVIVPAVIPCGECAECRGGRGTICPRQQMPGNDIHGGFATQTVVPARGLCPVDEGRLAQADLSLADLAVVADAVTTPYQAVLQAGIGPNMLVVVVGVGGIGGYSVQVAHAFGATVVALDIDQAKLDGLANHGAALALNLSGVDDREIKRTIRGFAQEAGLPDTGWCILECSGTAAGQRTAFSLLGYGATLCVVGFTLDKVEIRLSNLMAFHARALGNWGCLPEHYPAALDLVLDRGIELAPFIERHPLDDINSVLEAAHAGQLTRRAILVPDQKGKET